MRRTVPHHCELPGLTRHSTRADLVFFSDVADLWRQFDAFGPEHRIGVAQEQNPMYPYVSRCNSHKPATPQSHQATIARQSRIPCGTAHGHSQVTRHGGLAVNGGVQLLHMGRMRQGAYTALLERYASRDPSLPLGGNADGRDHAGIGAFGDQTLYSWMSLNGTPGHAWIKRLPCGFNVHAMHPLPGAHRCDDGCQVLHAASGSVETRRLVSELSEATVRGLDARECTGIFARFRDECARGLCGRGMRGYNLLSKSPRARAQESMVGAATSLAHLGRTCCGGDALNRSRSMRVSNL